MQSFNLGLIDSSWGRDRLEVVMTLRSCSYSPEGSHCPKVITQIGSRTWAKLEDLPVQSRSAKSHVFEWLILASWSNSSSLFSSSESTLDICSFLHLDLIHIIDLCVFPSLTLIHARRYLPVQDSKAGFHSWPYHSWLHVEIHSSIEAWHQLYRGNRERMAT